MCSELGPVLGTVDAEEPTWERPTVQLASRAAEAIARFTPFKRYVDAEFLLSLLDHCRLAHVEGPPAHTPECRPCSP